MLRSITWSLAFVVVLAAITLWIPDQPGTVIQAVDVRRAPEMFPTEHARPPRALPVALESLLIEAARRDPFLVTQPQPPPAPQSPPLLPPAPLAATTHQPAPLAWRVIGTMINPAGQRLVLLGNQTSDSMVATPGLMLDGGYEVISVQASGVQLRHPLSGVIAEISLPPQSPDE